MTRLEFRYRERFETALAAPEEIEWGGFEWWVVAAAGAAAMWWAAPYVLGAAWIVGVM